MPENQQTIERTKIRVTPDGRVNRADAAIYLGISINTLRYWQQEKRGPKPRKVGGKVFYTLADLETLVSSEAA